MRYEILPGELWQGDLGSTVGFSCDIVITCSWLSEVVSGIDLIFHQGVTHILFPFWDAAVLPDLARLKEIALCAEDAINHKKRVLVQCTEGHNRSGLMCGRIMQVMGMVDVVAEIKKVNPSALSNPTFASYLDSQE